MCTTEQPRSVGQKTVKAIQQLAENNPISYHVNNLHTLMVGWMRNLNHDPEFETDQEQVYHTYMELKHLLLMIERDFAGEQIAPPPEPEHGVFVLST